jgi:hypothetical protein
MVDETAFLKKGIHSTGVQRHRRAHRELSARRLPRLRHRLGPHLPRPRPVSAPELDRRPGALPRGRHSGRGRLPDQAGVGAAATPAGSGRPGAVRLGHGGLRLRGGPHTAALAGRATADLRAGDPQGHLPGGGASHRGVARERPVARGSPASRRLATVERRGGQQRAALVRLGAGAAGGARAGRLGAVAAGAPQSGGAAGAGVLSGLRPSTDDVGGAGPGGGHALDRGGVFRDGHGRGRSGPLRGAEMGQLVSSHDAGAAGPRLSGGAAGACGRDARGKGGPRRQRTCCR